MGAGEEEILIDDVEMFSEGIWLSNDPILSPKSITMLREGISQFEQGGGLPCSRGPDPDPEGGKCSSSSMK